jgi:hypothetical protein
MPKERHRPERAVIAELREGLSRLRALLPSLSVAAARKTAGQLRELTAEIEHAHDELDPIKDPGPSFDPGNPESAGRLVALALLAQDKIPLARIARAYGSGVYAIYYTGAHPAYAPISGTETPLYVGKADPAQPGAKTSREQGPRLFGRLSDHRRMIKTVEQYAIANGLPNPLHVKDFLCRRLVCVTGAQLVAEKHLIGIFRPVWNMEERIAFGISKHGDSAEMRQHGRSPWDVLHPGRPWAMESTTNQVSEVDVLRKLAEHFRQHAPYQDVEAIMDRIVAAFAQVAPMTSEDQAEAEDRIEAVSEGEKTDGGAGAS